MPKDKPIKAVAFNWHVGDYDSAGSYFGAIQVVLSNGVSSPVFRPKE